jgi:hypothetical protein
MVFYVFGQQLGIRASGADGRVNFTEAPCVVQVGVSITAPLGYTVTEGRNSSFFDGLTLSSGGARDVTFRLRKLP